MKVVHLETLTGRKVRDASGNTAGRLESVFADWRGDECIVTHYLITTKYFWRQFGFEVGKEIIVPWDRMDVSDERLVIRP